MTTGLLLKSILLLCAPRHNANFQPLGVVHICTSSYVSCVPNNQVFITSALHLAENCISKLSLQLFRKQPCCFEA